jgi:hypothetical protein
MVWSAAGAVELNSSVVLPVWSREVIDKSPLTCACRIDRRRDKHVRLLPPELKSKRHPEGRRGGGRACLNGTHIGYHTRAINTIDEPSLLGGLLLRRYSPSVDVGTVQTSIDEEIAGNAQARPSAGDLGVVPVIARDVDRAADCHVAFLHVPIDCDNNNNNNTRVSLFANQKV